MAQWLPSGPVAFDDGRVTVAGDVVASIAPHDTGFFNFTDYDLSALRLFQMDLAGAFVINSHMSLLGQVRSQNLESPDVLAAYLRVHPLEARQFDVQIGRIPRTFGAFPRRAYGADNFLIGYPLMYQYLTSLRDDAAPASTAELVGMRGRGSLSTFSVGNARPAAGVPLASAFHWDTGIQAHARAGSVDLTAAIATGSLSDPDVSLAHGLHRVDGRIAVHPVAGLIVGVSGSRGPFVTDGLLATLGASGGRFRQSALGADAEYSRDYYLIRVEGIGTWWTMPIGNPLPAAMTLSASGVSIEGRYKIRPALFVGARLDHVAFSDVATAASRAGWDAPVTRFELGGGYSLQRNLQLKGSCQYNTRAATRVSRVTICAGQMLFWF